MQKSNNLRKSNRKPTPNLKYTEDIHELIKESTEKKKNLDHSPSCSSSISERQESNVEQVKSRKSNEHLLTCIFGNGAMKNVKVIFSDETKGKQKNENVVSQKTKNSPSRLLILFKQVIENLSNSDGSNDEQERKNQTLRAESQPLSYHKSEFPNQRKEDGLLKIKLPKIQTNHASIQGQKQRERIGQMDENSYDRINLI